MKKPGIKKTTEIRVIPAKKVLSGTGSVWEYLLFGKGWNELDEKDKYGILVGRYKLKDDGYIVYDVYFPKLDITLKNIFEDEAILFTEDMMLNPTIKMMINKKRVEK